MILFLIQASLVANADPCHALFDLPGSRYSGHAIVLDYADSFERKLKIGVEEALRTRTFTDPRMKSFFESFLTSTTPYEQLSLTIAEQKWLNSAREESVAVNRLYGIHATVASSELDWAVTSSAEGLSAGTRTKKPGLLANFGFTVRFNRANPNFKAFEEISKLFDGIPIESRLKHSRALLEKLPLLLPEERVMLLALFADADQAVVDGIIRGKVLWAGKTPESTFELVSGQKDSLALMDASARPATVMRPELVEIVKTLNRPVVRDFLTVFGREQGFRTRESWRGYLGTFLSNSIHPNQAEFIGRAVVRLSEKISEISANATGTDQIANIRIVTLLMKTRDGDGAAAQLLLEGIFEVMKDMANDAFSHRADSEALVVPTTNAAPKSLRARIMAFFGGESAPKLSFRERFTRDYESMTIEELQQGLAQVDDPTVRVLVMRRIQGLQSVSHILEYRNQLIQAKSRLEKELELQRLLPELTPDAGIDSELFSSFQLKLRFHFAELRAKYSPDSVELKSAFLLVANQSLRDALKVGRKFFTHWAKHLAQTQGQFREEVFNEFLSVASAVSFTLEELSPLIFTFESSGAPVSSDKAVEVFFTKKFLYSGGYDSTVVVRNPELVLRFLDWLETHMVVRTESEQVDIKNRIRRTLVPLVYYTGYRDNVSAFSDLPISNQKDRFNEIKGLQRGVFKSALQMEKKLKESFDSKKFEINTRNRPEVIAAAEAELADTNRRLGDTTIELERALETQNDLFGSLNRLLGSAPAPFTLR